MARKSRRNSVVLEKICVCPNSYKTAVYARLSTEDGRMKNKETIVTQKRMADEYIKNRPYLKFIDYYVDNGYSGSNFNRPAFKKLMEHLKNKQIDCIVVKDFSRLGRDFLEMGSYLEKVFPALGVRFISINDGYDSEDCNKEYLTNALKNLINDMYSKDISKKVAVVQNMKQKLGEHVGGYAPYGYCYNNDKKLVINKETCGNVKRIFSLVLGGMSDRKIAELFNNEFIKSPSQYNFEKGIFHNDRYSKSMYWWPSTIKMISSNIVYLGHMAQHKTISSLPEHIRCFKIPSQDWIVVENTHEPIIDKNVFKSVQQIRKVKNQKYQKSNDNRCKSENMFMGLLLCGDCGKKMKRICNNTVDENKIRHYRFACTTYLKLSKINCTKKTLPESLLLESVKQIIYFQLGLAKKIKCGADHLKRKQKVNIPEVIKKHPKYYILSKSNEKCCIYEDYVNGKIDKKEYIYKSNQLNLEMQRLNKNFESETVITKNVNEELLSNISCELWNGNLLHELIEKIDVFDCYTVKITFQFSDVLKIFLVND